jgi:predicted metal-binding protein
MRLSDSLKCPGLERALAVFPEIFNCPFCGAEIEIWSDEKKGKCPFCGCYFIKGIDYNTLVDAQKHHFKVDILEHADEDGVRFYYERYEAVLPPSIFDHDSKFKIACEACKRYGTNLACPPFSPVFQDYVGEFHAAKTICIRVPQEYFSHLGPEDGYIACFRAGKRLLEQELLQFRKQSFKIAGAGPCLVCEECGIGGIDPKCRKPAKLIYSLESLGVNLISLAQKGFNINLQWSSNDHMADFVCVIGAAFFNKEE